MMNIVNGNKNSETSFENIMVLIMIFILVTISVQQYSKMIKYGKIAVYKEDVQRLNVALILYRLQYGKFPKNLSILANRRYLKKVIINGKIRYIKKNFLNNVKVDKKGYPISSAGKRFVYDSKNGRIVISLP